MNNNNYYFLFNNNNNINFLHINTTEINRDHIQNKNIVLIVLDKKIPPIYIYSLLKKFHIIKLYYLYNILLSIDFDYMLINIKHLYISCKKNSNSIFTNIYELDRQDINTCITKQIFLEDLIKIINRIESSQYKLLTFYEKLHINLNKYYYKCIFLNILILSVNLLIYFFIANK
jgi:hypothetical protein